MEEIKNEQLGNFGFLLEFGEGFLYQLAQLAESNLYLNKRMCAVFIRQLTENFFETVFVKENIVVNNENDINHVSSFILEKQKQIESFYKKSYKRYGKKVFPEYPGKLGDTRARVECPEGEGLNRWKNKLVDESMKTIYVWDFIRKIGNAGSHAVLSESNMKWLEERYLEEALRQLCNRMRIFFYGYNNRVNTVWYNRERQVMATGGVFYPDEKNNIKKNVFDGILPNYDEKKYYTVMPKLVNVEGKGDRWENYINKYSLIRKYEKTNVNDIQQYLLHSQKAYLRLQQIGECAGVAKYSVIADLRNSDDYYVTSYEFDVEPHDLSMSILEKGGYYEHVNIFISLILEFLETINTITAARIYHRALTHNSIKLCIYDGGDISLKVIDFELVKLFEENIECQPETVYMGLNGIQKLLKNPTINNSQCLLNIGQYGLKEWDIYTDEEDYLKEQERRTGMLISNMLCASHFDNSKQFSDYASIDEILNEKNLSNYKFDKAIVKEVAELADRLIKNKYTILDSLNVLKGIKEVVTR